MDRIQLTCQSCNMVHDLKKTDEIPGHVFIMKCNWCPDCEDSADDYYKEWWDDDENNPDNKPIPIGDNQLCMPFIIEEIVTENLEIIKE